MQSQKTIATENDNTRNDVIIDMLHEYHSLPELLSFINEVWKLALLDNIPITDHPNYQNMVDLLHSIPIQQLAKFNKLHDHKLARSFIEANFIEGLKYLATANDTSIFTKKSSDHATPLTAALRQPWKEPLRWLIEYFENHKISPCSTDLQKALLKDDQLKQFKTLVNKHRKKLPIEMMGMVKSDILEDACLLGNFAAVKYLCEYKNGKLISQFNFDVAVESSIYCNHSDITFYLWDLQLEKNFTNVIQQFYQMLKGWQYNNLTQSSTNWFFRKSFVERCIPNLLNHPRLKEEEKSLLLKMPVLFLMKTFLYPTNVKFQEVFGDALLLLKKDIPLPINIQNYIIKYRANVNVKRSRYGIKAGIQIVECGENITDFAEHPIIDINFNQQIKNIIFRMIKGEEMADNSNFFLNNLTYHADYLSYNLFGNIESSLRSNVLSGKNKNLIQYFLQNKPATACADSAQEISKNENLIQQLEKYIEDATDSNLNCSAQELPILCQFIFNSVNKYLENPNCFESANPIRVKILLENIIKLGINTSTFKYLKTDIIPILLRFNATSSAVHYLRELISSFPPSTCERHFLSLQFITINIMHKMNFSFDLSRMHNWMREGEGSQLIYRITSSALLNSSTSFKYADIPALLIEFQSISIDSLCNMEKKCPLSYVAEFLLTCETLLIWSNKTLAENLIPKEYILEALHLKEKILKLTYHLLSQSLELKFLVNEGQDDIFSRLKHHHCEMYHRYNEAIKSFDKQRELAKRAALVRFRPDPKITFKFPIDSESKYQNSQLVFFKDNIKADTKNSDYKALDLATPRSLAIAIRWYCNAIALINYEIKKIYDRCNLPEQAFLAEQSSIFYCNKSLHKDDHLWELNLTKETMEGMLAHMNMFIDYKLLSTSIYEKNMSLRKP